MTGSPLPHYCFREMRSRGLPRPATGYHGGTPPHLAGLPMRSRGVPADIPLVHGCSRGLLLELTWYPAGSPGVPRGHYGRVSEACSRLPWHATVFDPAASHGTPHGTPVAWHLTRSCVVPGVIARVSVVSAGFLTIDVPTTSPMGFHWTSHWSSHGRSRHLNTFHDIQRHFTTCVDLPRASMQLWFHHISPNYCGLVPRLRLTASTLPAAPGPNPSNMLFSLRLAWLVCYGNTLDFCGCISCGVGINEYSWERAYKNMKDKPCGRRFHGDINGKSCRRQRITIKKTPI